MRSVLVLCVFIAFAAAAVRADDDKPAAAKDPYEEAKKAGEKALADLEKTPTQLALDAFNKLQEDRKKLNPIKGKKQKKQALPHTSEKLKVPIPIAKIHDPFLLKPIHSVFKCDTLLDKKQIARCTECFRKGLPAPWEVIGYQANNAQCRVGHTIIPVALLDAGLAATATSAEQIMAEDAAAEAAADEEEEAAEDEAADEAEDEDESEVDEEADEEVDEEAEAEAEEDMALLEVADADEEEETADESDAAEDEEEAVDSEESEAEDEAEAEEEDLFDAAEENEFEDQAAADETAFLELAHAQIDAAYRAFRDENDL